MKAGVWRNFWLLALEAATNLLGYAGVAFIAYGTIVAAIKVIWGAGATWDPIEATAATLSSGLTLAGTALTAASVYFYSPTPPPPEPISTKITAPTVILLSLGCLGLLAWVGLPTVVVNGFAILGLAGCLFRLRPNPIVAGEKKH